jgi:hypothetical protein
MERAEQTAKRPDLTREEQAVYTLCLIRELRADGWAEATVEVARGGTFRVHVKAEGDKVVRPAFGTGRGK